MKKFLILICAVLCANVLLAQQVAIYPLRYTINNGEATVTMVESGHPGNIVIPDYITDNGTNYPVTKIAGGLFKQNTTITSIEIGKNVREIGKQAFFQTNNLSTIIFHSTTPPDMGNNNTFHQHPQLSITIPYGSNYSSIFGGQGLNASNLDNIIGCIDEGTTVTITGTETIYSDPDLENGELHINSLIINGTLIIAEGGQLINESGKSLVIGQNAQLINKSDTPVNVMMEVETPILRTDRWSFVGAPFNSYKLEAIKEGSQDVSVSLFDYNTGNWSNDWATIENYVGAGEGFFLWSFAAEPTIFTTKPANSDNQYYLNNGDVTVQKNVTGDESTGRWIALANPYPAKLSIDAFVDNNNSIQGQGVYVLTNTVNGEYQTWDYIENGDINICQGFFVNLTNGSNAITFTKTQLTNYSGNQKTSKIKREKEYIRFAMIESERESEILFAHNEDAEQEYDIFDANKLFSPMEIAEPYLVTNNIALVKEEVKALPYTAELNVKSYENKEVTFRANNIPEGINVYLFDNEEIIKMNGGIEYTTDITAGENANRFKLLVRKQARIENPIVKDVTIKNDNRNVKVQSDVTNLRIEVYNSLGRKVFETTNYNFTLNQVPAGAYMIKAFNNQVRKTQKIVVE